MSAVGFALVALGAMVLYAGMTGTSLPAALKDVLDGKAGGPDAGGPGAANTATGGSTNAPTTGGLSPAFAGKLAELIAASGGRIRITSGYRSPQRQRELWAAALVKYGSEAAARKWVAKPGTSNHERGLAADLAFTGGGQTWAHANAGRYGLHFPLSWEPWHIEPKGA